MALAANIPSRDYALDAQGPAHVRRWNENPMVTEMKEYIFARYKNITTIFPCQIIPITPIDEMFPPCRAREDAYDRQTKCESFNGAYAKARCFCDEGYFSRRRKMIDDTVECAELRGCAPEVVERIRCDKFRTAVAYQDGCGKYLPRIFEATKDDIYYPSLSEIEEALPFDPEVDTVKGVPETCTDTSQASWGVEVQITVDGNGASVELSSGSTGSSTTGGNWGLKNVAVLGLLVSSILTHILL